jgi:uroporphyrinogen-III synthase
MDNMPNHSSLALVSKQDQRILSTKRLPKKAREYLLQSGLLVCEVPFIKNRYRRFCLKEYTDLNAIFTSSKAVKSLQSNDVDFSKIDAAFCVGAKTAGALRESGVEVAVEAKNASELGHKISERYRERHFMAFTGNLRRKELFEILAQHTVPVKEMVVYDTIIHKKRLEEQAGRVLFFSPSGVKGYVWGGNNIFADAYCLGTTTAGEADKYFSHVHAAPEPTLKSLMEYVVNDIKNNEQNQKIEK